MDARVKGTIVCRVLHGGGWCGRATGPGATTTVTLRCAGRNRRTVSGRELPLASIASRDRKAFYEGSSGGSGPSPGHTIGVGSGRDLLRLGFTSSRGLVG